MDLLFWSWVQPVVDITVRGEKLYLFHLSRLYYCTCISMAGRGKLSNEMMKSHNGEDDIVAWLKKAK